MKTKIFLFFFLLFLTISKATAGVTEAQASEILKKHFVNLSEVKKFYPDLSELTIPYSLETLKKNRSAWLLPVKTKKGFEYLLIRANFEGEICMLKKVDTLRLETAKEVLFILKKLRPNFPDKSESGKPFKYFYRTKDYAFSDGKTIYKKIVSYNGENFITVNWPNKVEIGVMYQEYISYLTTNESGVEIQLGVEALPFGHPKVKEQSIYILTLLRYKTQ